MFTAFLLELPCHAYHACCLPWRSKWYLGFYQYGFNNWQEVVQDSPWNYLPIEREQGNFSVVVRVWSVILSQDGHNHCILKVTGKLFVIPYSADEGMRHSSGLSSFRTSAGISYAPRTLLLLICFIAPSISQGFVWVTICSLISVCGMELNSALLTCDSWIRSSSKFSFQRAAMAFLSLTMCPSLYFIRASPSADGSNVSWWRCRNLRCSACLPQPTSLLL